MYVYTFLIPIYTYIHQDTHAYTCSPYTLELVGPDASGVGSIGHGHYRPRHSITPYASLIPYIIMGIPLKLKVYSSIKLSILQIPYTTRV